MSELPPPPDDSFLTPEEKAKIAKAKEIVGDATHAFIGAVVGLTGTDAEKKAFNVEDKVRGAFKSAPKDGQDGR